MRLLQLDPEGRQPSGEAAPDDAVLDFHPRLTVVTGLSPAGHDRVVRALTALPGGRDPGCPGLVEAHGIILNLDAATLDVLGLGTDLDVLVRAGDLPGRGGGAVIAAEATVRVDVDRFLAATPEGRHPDLDEARRAQRDARSGLQVLREATERSRRQYDEVLVRRERLEAALAAARRRLETGVTDERAVLTGLTHDQIQARRAELAADADAHWVELERIEHGLAELGALDTRPIEVLLEAIRNPQPVEYVGSARALELADEVVALRRKLDELEDRMEAEGRGPGPALHRLEEARVAVQAAERAMAKPDLSPDDVAELEAAHDEVLEAEQRTAGPFGRRNQKRLDEALVAQQAILDRVGFPTWSAYVMGAGLMSVDPMAEMRLEKARFELEAAEANWADISTALEANPLHRELLDQLEEVYLEAYDLLGGAEPDDLEAALREIKVPRQEVTTAELVDALVYQLELVGLQLPEPVGVDLATTAAEAFLAEAAGIGARVEELRAERRDAENRLHAVAEELAALDAADDGATGAPDRGADDEDDLLLVGPGPTPADEVAALAAELEVVRSEEHDVADALEARSTLVDAATQVEAVATSRLVRIAGELAEHEADRSAMTDPAYELDDADTDVDAAQEAIEFYLLTRLAAQRTVSYAGSVPLVLDDALADVPDDEVRALLGKLERMSEAVQIVYLSDDARVVRWADGAGINRAAVVPAPPRSPSPGPRRSATAYDLGASPHPRAGVAAGGALTVITEDAIRRLAEFRSAGAPVVSCYLDVDGRRLVRPQDVEGELDRALRPAREGGDERIGRDLRRIEDHVHRGLDRSRTRGLALFSCQDPPLWQVVPLPVSVRSRVVVNDAPAVQQLEAVTQELERFGVLLVDRQRARMFVFQFGELVDRSELLDELPRDYDNLGERDQSGYDKALHHVEELVARHLRHAGEVAFRLYQDDGFERLVVGAPDELTGAVEAALHPYLRERLSGRIRVGVAASLDEVRTAALEVEARVERDKEAEAVARLRDAVASGGRGVAGLDDTLRSLVERRVDVLFVSDGYSETGWRCPSCRYLSYKGPRCPVDGTEMAKVGDVVEEAVDVALAQSCRVEVCAGNADLDVLGRIGALLRY